MASLRVAGRQLPPKLAKLPGKFKPSDGKCFVGVNGAAVAVSPFDVLTSPAPRQ
jgi:hypothetical protein